MVTILAKNNEREDILHALRIWLRDYGDSMVGESRPQLEALVEKIDCLPDSPEDGWIEDLPDDPVVLKQHLQHQADKVEELKAQVDNAVEYAKEGDGGRRGLQELCETLEVENEELKKYKKAAEFSKLSLMVESNGRCSLHDMTDRAERHREKTLKVISANADLECSLRLALETLNEIPNQELTGRFETSYEVCSEIEKALKRVEEDKDDIPLDVLALRRIVEEMREWSEDDDSVPEDEQIRRAHPLETKDFDTYNEALRMVGAKKSKYALVDLVNWLISKNKGESK